MKKLLIICSIFFVSFANADIMSITSIVNANIEDPESFGLNIELGTTTQGVQYATQQINESMNYMSPQQIIHNSGSGQMVYTLTFFQPDGEPLYIMPEQNFGLDPTCEAINFAVTYSTNQLFLTAPTTMPYMIFLFSINLSVDEFGDAQILISSCKLIESNSPG